MTLCQVVDYRLKFVTSVSSLDFLRLYRGSETTGLVAIQFFGFTLGRVLSRVTGLTSLNGFFRTICKFLTVGKPAVLFEVTCLTASIANATEWVIELNF